MGGGGGVGVLALTTRQSGREQERICVAILTSAKCSMGFGVRGTWGAVSTELGYLKMNQQSILQRLMGGLRCKPAGGCIYVSYAFPCVRVGARVH